MGLVYYHKSKLRHAEHHFRRAADINPTNAALLSSIGEVLEQSDDIAQAHEYYLMALKYAPTSAGVRYKAIRALVAMQRIDVSYYIAKFCLSTFWIWLTTRRKRSISSSLCREKPQTRLRCSFYWANVSSRETEVRRLRWHSPPRGTCNRN